MHTARSPEFIPVGAIVPVTARLPEEALYHDVDGATRKR